jgi:hypothetical protein
MTMTTRKRIARNCLLIAMLSFGGSCSVAHGGPQDGTETGNPPVIDVTRVMLVVGASDAKITGSAGAVSPGGGELQVQSSLTGKTYTTEVAADGSFEISISGSPEDTFELRAADESGNTDRAAPVYIARGSSAVSGGAQGLTCKQRESLAGAQMSAVVEAVTPPPDNYCKADSDCRLQQVSTVCTDACSGVAVSVSGGAQIERAREAIASGVCRNFSESGCTFTIFPCVPPTPSALRCVSGTCTLAPLTRTDKPGCSEAFDAGTGAAVVPSYWFSGEAQACLPRTYGGLGGNANRYQTRSACEAACKPLEPACEAPRVSVNVCLEGGLAGGCALPGLACALPCTSPDQCAGDPVGSWCAGGFCDATSPE